MKHRLLKGLLATAAAVAVTATPAMAGPDTPNRGRFAALGDSYAAGLGNESLIKNSGLTGRTTAAYPVVLAGDLVNKVTFLAASGASTQTVLETQVPLVPATARQITVTVGGNDIGFATVALTCAAHPDACSAAVMAAAESVSPMAQRLGILIGAVKARAPQATIYVTGYPKIFQPDPLQGCALEVPLSAVAAADAAIVSLNAAIEGVAASQDAVYVDVTGEIDAGLCTAPGVYLYPPTQDPSGPGGFAVSSLHPTALGQAAYARAVQDAGFVGTP